MIIFNKLHTKKCLPMRDHMTSMKKRKFKSSYIKSQNRKLWTAPFWLLASFSAWSHSLSPIYDVATTIAMGLFLHSFIPIKVSTCPISTEDILNLRLPVMVTSRQKMALQRYLHPNPCNLWIYYFIRQKRILQMLVN